MNLTEPVHLGLQLDAGALALLALLIGLAYVVFVLLGGIEGIVRIYR